MSSLLLSALAAGCAVLGGIDLFPQDSWTAAAAATPQARAYAHYIAAVVQERRGRLDLAMDALNEVAALDPEAVTPLLGLLRAHRRQGDLESALKVSRRATALEPDNADLWLIQGESHHALQQFDEAITCFNKAIELRPDDLLGYGALVEVQEQRNDMVAAVDIYERLIARNPESAALYYQLAGTLTQINDRDGAMAAYRKVVELEPRVVQAHLLLGVLLLDAGQHDEAVARLKHYLDLRPGDVTALESLAGACERAGNTPDALACMRLILGGKEAAPKHYFQAAWLLFRTGECGAANETAPESGAPLLAGMLRVLCLLAEGGDPAEEVAALDAMEGDLEQETATTLADMLRLFGFSEAGTQLFAALDSDNAAVRGSRVLRGVRGRVLEVLERWSEAAAVFGELAASDPMDRWSRYHLATCHEKLKNDVETERNLKAFLELDPDNAEALNYLGYFYAERGVNLKEAEALLNRALKLEPDNPFYLDSLGWVYFRMGRCREALDHVQRAVYGMNTDDAVLRDHLGDIHLCLGDTARAVAEWQRALRLDPKMDEVRKKLRRHQKPRE